MSDKNRLDGKRSDGNSRARPRSPGSAEVNQRADKTVNAAPPKALIPGQTIVLEVSAAYNRDGMAMPKPNGPNGRRVLNLEMLMNHPLYWEFLNERETEEVLMELYIARTRRMQ